MKLRKSCIALLMILALCFSAHAESSLTPFIDAAEKLAFETDNVTITGKAEFLLDGKRFKTAEITYVQDGENSFWQEKLLTPRAWRSDLESGFTVIQNGMDIYVMETLKPGLYRSGSDNKQNTLLRRTAHADLLFALARTVTEQTVPFLETAASLTEEENGNMMVQFDLTEGDTPALLSQLANLCMRFIGKRLTGDGDDEYDVSEISSLPVATETFDILVNTKTLNLSDCSVRISLDGEGRLNAASGVVSARVKGYSGGTRLLTVRFETALSGYGESTVPLFDPKDYQVMTQWEREAAGIEAPEKEMEPIKKPEWLEERAKEVCEAAGVSFGEVTDSYFFYDFCNMDAQINGKRYEVILSDDQAVLCIDQTNFRPDFKTCDEPVDDELTQRIRSFLTVANPSLDIGEIRLIGQTDDEIGKLFWVYVKDPDGDFGCHLTVRQTPEWQIEEYDAIGFG